jgi:hypothetical protein
MRTPKYLNMRKKLEGQKNMNKSLARIYQYYICAHQVLRKNNMFCVQYKNDKEIFLEKIF